MRKFQSLDRQARINSDYELDTKHQNTLTCLRIHSESNESVTKFTSSGLDGKIILWELNVSILYNITVLAQWSINNIIDINILLFFQSLDKLLQGLKI